MNRRKIEKIIALAILASMLSITTVSAAEVTKDESVYVNLDSSGKLDKITVSDWLHSTDSNGKFEDESELDDIKNVKRTIAIACGDDKIMAIACALKTKLINTLITDEYTAKKIIEKKFDSQ